MCGVGSKARAKKKDREDGLEKPGPRSFPRTFLCSSASLLQESGGNGCVRKNARKSEQRCSTQHPCPTIEENPAPPAPTPPKIVQKRTSVTAFTAHTFSRIYEMVAKIKKGTISNFFFATLPRWWCEHVILNRPTHTPFFFGGGRGFFGSQNPSSFPEHVFLFSAKTIGARC